MQERSQMLEKNSFFNLTFTKILKRQPYVSSQMPCNLRGYFSQDRYLIYKADTCGHMYFLDLSKKKIEHFRWNPSLIHTNIFSVKKEKIYPLGDGHVVIHFPQQAVLMIYALKNRLKIEGEKLKGRIHIEKRFAALQADFIVRSKNHLFFGRDQKLYKVSPLKHKLLTSCVLPIFNYDKRRVEDVAFGKILMQHFDEDCPYEVYDLEEFKLLSSFDAPESDVCQFLGPDHIVCFNHEKKTLTVLEYLENSSEVIYRANNVVIGILKKIRIVDQTLYYLNKKDRIVCYHAGMPIAWVQFPIDKTSCKKMRFEAEAIILEDDQLNLKVYDLKGEMIGEFTSVPFQCYYEGLLFLKSLGEIWELLVYDIKHRQIVLRRHWASFILDNGVYSEFGEHKGAVQVIQFYLRQPKKDN